MDYIKIYKEEHLSEAIEKSIRARNLIDAFQRDYPIEKIEAMSMDEYMFVPARDGAQAYTFCNRIDKEMDTICHSGNVRPNIYGIYCSGGKIKISPSFASCQDTDVVFRIVKQEILFLLRGVAKGNFDVVKNCKLNSSFKYKLLAIYFPDLIVPVQTKWLLDEYCDRVGVMYYPKEEMVYRNIALRKWKDNNPEISDWNNSVLMYFCGWLVSTEKRL